MKNRQVRVDAFSDYLFAGDDHILHIITKDLCWSDMTEMNSHIQNIPFKILMFSFSIGSKFRWTFLPIIAILIVAICSIDIYDMKAVAYYFMKANLATGMNDSFLFVASSPLGR